MNEDMIAGRVHDAVEACEIPPYPRAAVFARLAAPRAVEGRARRPVVATAVLAAAALAIVAASAAVAVPQAIPDRVLRALDRVGIHLRGKQWIALEVRDASLDEARSTADFTVVVPRNVRIVRTNVATDPVHHHTLIGFVLQYDGRSQIGLDEARVVPPRPGHGTRSRDNISYRVEANGKVIPERIVVWTIGNARLTMVPYDAKSRAFAESVRRETLATAAATR